MLQYLLAILSSGAIASFITYLSTQHVNIRGYKVQYITKERQEWRKDIKRNIAEFCTCENKRRKLELKIVIALSLNPHDNYDQKIVDCLECLIAEVSDEKLKDLENKVSILLKNDWERAKKEVEFRNWKNIKHRLKSIIFYKRTKNIYDR